MRTILYVASLLLIFCHLVTGQNLNKQIQSLEDDFRQFKYQQVIEKGRFFLADPYASKKDSLQIYQFMLSSAYALDDTTMARNIIKEILHTEPTFTLDIRNTSPKIIEFFNYIKQQILNKKTTPNTLVKKDKTSVPSTPTPIKAEHLVFSVFLPGSGHILAGYPKSGYLRSSTSVLLLAGMVYSSIETNHKRGAYLSAATDSDFNELYDRYNTFYKIRNAFLIGYGLWSLYNLYDLQHRRSWQVSVSSDSRSLSLNLSACW